MFNNKKEIERVEKLHADITTLYQAVIDEKEVTILRLTEELTNCRAKISLMELALMPLSSAAGAAYVSAQNPRPNVKAMESIDEPTISWQQVLEDHNSKLEAEYEADAKRN